MPSTNKTPNIGIGQYLPNDVLSWNDINADNALVDTAVGKCWNSENYKRETGDCEISVSPSRLGISPESIVKYTIMGNKCFIDMYLVFDGTGTSGKTEPVTFSVLPVPGIAGTANVPMVYIAATAASTYTAGYVNLHVTENWGSPVFHKGGSTLNFSSMATTDIKASTSIRGQFWYEIAQ